MLIVGMTACEKTHYLLKMLEKDFKGHFDYVFFVCPTFLENKTYQEWKYLKDLDVFALPCDHDEVETTLETIVRFAKGTNSFIGRLRILPDGEKQNQRAGKTCLTWKAHRVVHDCHHTATHDHCETLQDERLQGGVLLHRPQGRPQRHLRKLPLRRRERGEKDHGNFEKGEVRPVGDLDGVSVHTHKVVIP